MPKIGINISDRSLKYLDKAAKNRSAFIDRLIEEKRKKDFQEELEKAYIDQENDPEFHAEVEAWDCVVGDGIDEEE